MVLLRARSSSLLRGALWRAGAASRRALCSYQFDPFGAAEKWPKTRQNTLINQCPEGELAVVERFGKMDRVVTPGWFLAVPVVEQIAYVVDTRARTLDVVVDSATTTDNVAVHVGGVLGFKFVDAERAAYGSSNPLLALRQAAVQEVRAAVGGCSFDDAPRLRATLSQQVVASLAEPARAWGIEVTSFVLSELAPERIVAEAMDRLAVTERQQRQAVAEAEATATAKKVAADARRAARRHDAQTDAECALIRAEAEALATALRAQAYAKAIADLEVALKTQKSSEAARLVVAMEHIAALAPATHANPPLLTEVDVLKLIEEREASSSFETHHAKAPPADAAAAAATKPPQ